MIGGTRIKPVAKSGDEMDVASKYARSIHLYTQRAGVCARAKRAMRRRLRREAVPILGMCILILGTTGCDRMAMLVKPEPYNAQVAPECNLPCDQPMDLPDGDGNTLLAVSKVNRAYLARCSVRHEACQQALDRLKSARVIQ